MTLEETYRFLEESESAVGSVCYFLSGFPRRETDNRAVAKHTGTDQRQGSKRFLFEPKGVRFDML